MYDLMLRHQNKFGGIAWRNGEDEQFSDAARLSSSDLILVDPQMERDMRNDNHFRSTAPLNEPLAAQLEGNKSKCVQWLHLAWIKSPFFERGNVSTICFFFFPGTSQLREPNRTIPAGHQEQPESTLDDPSGMMSSALPDLMVQWCALVAIIFQFESQIASEMIALFKYFSWYLNLSKCQVTYLRANYLANDGGGSRRLECTCFHVQCSTLKL